MLPYALFCLSQHGGKNFTLKECQKCDSLMAAIHLTSFIFNFIIIIRSLTIGLAKLRNKPQLFCNE